jgi:hypothetical protein
MDEFEETGECTIRDLDEVRAVDRWAREYAGAEAGRVKLKS